MVVIGLDPHSATHTAVAMDPRGKPLSMLTVSNCSDGYAELSAWAEQFSERRWAIEGANHPFIRPFSQPLAVREWVVDIPASLTSQYRSRRSARKNDQIDATNAARALLANPQLPRYNPHPQVQELKELTRTRQQLAADLHALKNTLGALTEVSPAALPLKTAITCLERQIEVLDGECERCVEQLTPSLLKVYGVGVVHAATLPAEVGDIRRFSNKDRFASYCGCAPVERQSGGCRRAQLNIAGNRRLNRTLHMIAIVRLRYQADTKAYVNRKVEEGKTKRAALRCLKTHIARELYRFMTAAFKQHPYPNSGGA